MSKKDLAKFSEEVFRLMPLIIKGVHKRERDMLGVGQISVPQFLLMSFLHSKNLMKMKDIAKELNVTMPAATGIVDRMVSMEMLKRMYDEKDRRAIYIALTDKGEKTLGEIRSRRRKAIESVFGKLTEKERNAYVSVLQKVVATLYPKENEK